MHSYTAEDLERATGFDRRTIAYYIQEGLLPKVGRRGRRTRYPKLVRDRLLFIRRVREAEETGEVRAVSLRDMRQIFERLPPELIADVADRHRLVDEEMVAAVPDEEVPQDANSPAKEQHFPRDETSGELRDLVRAEPSKVATTELSEQAERSISGTKPGDSQVVDAPKEAEELVEAYKIVRASVNDPVSPTATMELAGSLTMLQRAARERQSISPGLANTWHRIEISPEIALSVRGLSEEDTWLLERVRTSMLGLFSDRSA